MEKIDNEAGLLLPSSKKPVILHVISSLSFGGAESLLTDFLLNASASQYEHVVAYIHDGYYKKKLEKAGIRVFPLLKSLKTAYDPFVFYRMFKLICFLRPVCIQTWLWYAGVIGRVGATLTQTPLIETVHQDVAFDGFFRFCIDKLTRFLSQTVVAVSDQVSYSLQRREQYFIKNKPIVIKNAIAPLDTSHDLVLRQKLRAQLKIKPSQKLILAVGRFVPIKNFPFIFEAFRHYLFLGGDGKLVVIGSGPLEKQLRTLADELRITRSTVFLGACDAAPYFPAADFFVQASLTEGISIALLQAMQRGVVPVVSAGYLSHPVIEDKKNGRITNNAHPINVASILYELSGVQTHYAELSLSARETISSLFSLERMYTEYKKLYEQKALKITPVGSIVPIVKTK